MSEADLWDDNYEPVLNSDGKRLRHIIDRLAGKHKGELYAMSVDDAKWLADILESNEMKLCIYYE